MDGNVSLTISKDIVQPIVESKVKEAILAALGGSEKVVELAINTVLHQKVDSEGKVSKYSSENKHSWMDIVITKTIQDVAREQVKEILAESSLEIMKALKKQLKSDAGSSLIAAAMLDGFNKSFESKWESKVKVTFEKPEREY